MTFHLEEVHKTNEKRSQIFASMGIFGMAAQSQPIKKSKAQKLGMQVTSNIANHINSFQNNNQSIPPPPPSNQYQMTSSSMSMNQNQQNYQMNQSNNSNQMQSQGKDSTVTLPNGYIQSLPYSFAEPTFSELMRRFVRFKVRFDF